MPIIDVSGLTRDEADVKAIIRAKVKTLFGMILAIPEDSTTVTFITDDTTGPNEHVMARLYSKSFVGMSTQDLAGICDSIVAILEEAGHPYNEAFPIPVLTMRGKCQ